MKSAPHKTAMVETLTSSTKNDDDEYESDASDGDIVNVDRPGYHLQINSGNYLAEGAQMKLGSFSVGSDIYIPAVTLRGPPSSYDTYEDESHPVD